MSAVVLEKDADAQVEWLVQMDDGKLKIQSRDGKEGRISARWLRLFCECEICGDTRSGKRWLSPADVSAGISTEEIESQGPDMMMVTWDDGHRSIYKRESLEDFADDGKSGPGPERFRPEPWGAGLTDRLGRFDYDEVVSSDRALYGALRAIRDDGIVMLTNVPAAPEDTLRIASRFGPVRETSYGKVFDLISKPDARVAGETSRAQLPHTDEPFRYAPPGFIFFHSIKAAASAGGTSIMVDGFKIAAQLRAEQPRLFEILCRTGITHRRIHDGEVHFETEAHVIALDTKGAVTGIRFNDRCLAPQAGSADEIDDLLEALAAFTRLAQDDRLQFRHQLRPGEMLVFDNERVLHGRTEFDPTIAARHLRSCNIDRDAMHSAFRTLATRFEPNVADEVLYQGAIL